MKDPAFLFYPGDWMGGTMGMTLEEKGGYMELLILQFNKGAFTIAQARKTLNGSFERLWGELKEKFQEYEGRFFNARLELEKTRRSAFIKKQSSHGKMGGRPKKNPNETQPLSQTISQTKPIIEDENEDENRIEDEDENFEKSEKLLIPEMLEVWKTKKPNYPADKNKDFAALGELAKFISDQLNLPYNPRDGDTLDKILSNWAVIAEFVAKTDHFNSYNLGQVAKYSQTIVQKIQHGGSKNGKQPAKITGADLDPVFAKRYPRRE